MNSQNELKHYGVLGMKWGVRRNRNSYSKATTKEAKSKAIAGMEKTRDKAVKKFNKLDKKATKSLNKLTSKRYGIFGSSKRYTRAKAVAERRMYKADKWYKNMEKTFAKQSIVSIPESVKNRGEYYCNYFAQTHADYANSAYAGLQDRKQPFTPYRY